VTETGEDAGKDPPSVLICLRCGQEWEPWVHPCDVLFGDVLVKVVRDGRP
jgi:hypothetical protein